VLLAVNVRTEEPVVGFGVNEAVRPLGRPEAARVTLPVNPGCGITAIVDAIEVPCIIPEEATEGLIEKVGWETVRERLVATFNEP